MSIEKLTSTIIESAQNKANEIIDKYQQEIQKVKEDTKQEIESLTNENNEQVAQQKNLIETRMISNAQLKAQQELLKTKWAVIDEIFKKGHDKFIASDKYYTLLKEIITKNTDKNSEIIVSKKDLDELRKLLPDVKLSANDNLTGGLIIKKRRVEQNYSLDRIITSLKNELVIDLSKLLFEK